MYHFSLKKYAYFNTLIDAYTNCDIKNIEPIAITANWSNYEQKKMELRIEINDGLLKYTFSDA